MNRLCHDAGTSETGGILIGSYSDDLSVAFVREATPPPSDSRRGPSWFVRGFGDLRNVLSKRWRAKPRTHYLGEWHFHPAVLVEPSDEDFAQMVEISTAKQYNCREPLLLIVGAVGKDRSQPLRAFVCPAGGKPLECLPKIE